MSDGKSSVDAVFCAMRERVFYRPADLAEPAGVGRTTVYYALRELSGGGVVDCVKDGRWRVYITRQEGLFR